MMTCSSTCHKKAKKQRRECSKSSLATLQPQTDTDMEYAEIAALGESKDFPVIAPTQLLHKRAMPEGSHNGIDNSLPAIKSSPTSSNTERPKAHRKPDFRPPLSDENDTLSNITSDKVNTSPLSVQDSMLCASRLRKIEEDSLQDFTNATSKNRERHQMKT